MAKSGNRIEIPNQLAVILILLAQPALLMGQQLAVNTPPEIFARPATGFAEIYPSLSARAVAATDRDALVISSNVRTITPALLIMVPSLEQKPQEHRFWDRQNRTLFTLNAALAGADFATTRRNLNHSGKELNPMTRVLSGSTPGLAANFAMETGGVIGVSYLFHKTGHHKLERVASYANLGASAFAVSYGLAHR
jgi:hypothetical protein